MFQADVLCAVSLLFAIISLEPATAARILIYPLSHCANSHLFNSQKMAALLSREQHNVTFLVHESYRHLARNHDVNIIRYSAPSNFEPVCGSKISLDSFLETPLWKVVTTFYSATYQSCDGLLGNVALRRRLRDEKFDLAIYDAVDPCSRILADDIGAPFIVFYTQGIETATGQHHPAYSPSLLTTYTDDMTLWQRTVNVAGHAVQAVIASITLAAYQRLQRRHNSRAPGPLSTTYDRAGAKFILGDHALDYVTPLRPTEVLLGGFIIGQEQEIEAHIERFIRGGRFILVSFGTIIRYHGPHYRELMAAALARLPYRVLWRYAADEPTPQALGSNTMLVPWLPQTALLARANVSMMVTHAGMNTAFETAYYGVPVVAIPIFGDQAFQASKLTVRVQAGVRLDIRRLTADALHDAIMRVDQEPAFRLNAHRTSYLMSHRPAFQRDVVLHWVDTIQRFNGSDHLHVPRDHAPWYRLALLDVAAVCITLVLGVGAATAAVSRSVKRALAVHDRAYSQCDTFH